MKWKPISTAPKDGREILLAEVGMIEGYGPCWEIAIGHWGKCEVFGVMTECWNISCAIDMSKPQLWNKIPHFDINEHLGVVNEDN